MEWLGKDCADEIADVVKIIADCVSDGGFTDGKSN